MTGLAKPCMSIDPMASPTFCLVSIEVSSLTVTSDSSCLVLSMIMGEKVVVFCFPLVLYYIMLGDHAVQ